MASSSFENFLLFEKGYEVFVFRCKTGKYEKPNKHDVLSSLGNLYFSYFPKDDPVIEKINLGYSVHDGITTEDIKNEIIYGLNESKKPPTIIWPRPKLKPIIQDKETMIIQKNYCTDDIMNRIIQKYTNEEVFNIINSTEYFELI